MEPILLKIFDKSYNLVKQLIWNNEIPLVNDTLRFKDNVDHFKTCIVLKRIFDFTDSSIILITDYERD